MKTIRVEQDPASYDVLERLWKNRDFELQHLWQRSIFLTTFLSLCLIGYGKLILSVFENHYSAPKLLAVNVAAVGICALGMVFSALWIAMARGSKAWYEWYEYAIRHYCAEHCFDNDTAKELPRYLSPKNYPLLHGSRTDIQGLTISERLGSNQGGAFSPSKINVCIGYVTVISFSILCLVHLCFCVGLCFNQYFCLHLFKEWRLRSVVVLTVLCLVGGIVLSRGFRSMPRLLKCVRSSSLSFLPTQTNNYGKTMPKSAKASLIVQKS